MLIKNGKVFIDGSYHNVDIRTEDGKIRDIDQSSLSSDDIVIDAADLLVFPGFVDIHMHGGYMLNFLDGEESVRALCDKLPSTGITSVVPTMAPRSDEQTVTAVRGIRAAKGTPGADILGLHFEGPYFSPKRNASMYLPAQKNPDQAHSLAMADGDLSDVLMICVAPELPGAMEWIKWVVSQGIKVELCYTTASSTQIFEAADLGATQLSHLYNGYEPMTHKADGPVPACLIDDRLYAQLLCDGIFVAPVYVKLALKTKGIDRCLGITDASNFMGMPEGHYKTDIREVIIKDGAVRDSNGMLLSGYSTWDQMMRRAKDVVGLTLEEIGCMYAENPCRTMDITDRGKIEVGRRADFTLTDEDLNIKKTIILEKVYFEA